MKTSTDGTFLYVYINNEGINKRALHELKSEGFHYMKSHVKTTIKIFKKLLKKD